MRRRARRHRRLRPTLRGAMVLALGLVLQGAGANASSGFVLLVACGALGALLVAAVDVHRARRDVVVVRRPPTTAAAGELAEVVWRVAGLGRVEAVLVDTGVGAVATVADDGEVRAAVRPERGRLGGGPVELRLTDALGLVAVWRRLVPEDEPVVVVPRPRAASGVAADADTDGAAGRDRARPRGEPAGLREHRSGDALALVHWRATARRGRPMTRLATAPAGRDVVVALEGGEWARPQLDLACEVAVGLASGATADGRRVVLDADGTSERWTAAAPTRLALLGPAAGVAARPLGAPSDAWPPGTERLLVSPTADGVAVTGPDGVAAVPLGGADGAVSDGPASGVSASDGPGHDGSERGGPSW